MRFTDGEHRLRKPGLIPGFTATERPAWTGYQNPRPFTVLTEILHKGLRALAEIYTKQSTQTHTRAKGT